MKLFNFIITFREGFQSPIGYNEAEFLVSVISQEDGARKVCKAWSNTKNDRRNEINGLYQSINKNSNNLVSENVMF